MGTSAPAGAALVAGAGVLTGPLPMTPGRLYDTEKHPDPEVLDFRIRVLFGGLGRRAAFACWKSSKSPHKLEVSRTDYDITAKNKDMISAASFHPGHKDLPRTLLPLL